MREAGVTVFLDVIDVYVIEVLSQIRELAFDSEGLDPEPEARL